MDRTFRLNGWEFWLRRRAAGWTLEVPDCGGMADSVPKIPAQLTWAEREFASLPALQQIWPVTWTVPESALTDLEAFFTRHGATG